MAPRRSFLMCQRCWREVTRKMPIPCVDTIVWNGNRFLMGWRKIPPYRNVWALLGGRISRGESFARTSICQCRESGVTIHEPHFLGTYPVIFSSRHDIVICMAAKWKSGDPSPTSELSRYEWFETDMIDKIKPIGANYKRMLQDWQTRVILSQK
jgi:ADP-ribose pyrophosphatase YjhB (NUDIX family)